MSVRATECVSASACARDRNYMRERKLESSCMCMCASVCEGEAERHDRQIDRVRLYICEI